MKLPPGYIAGQGLHQATGFGGLGQRMMEQMGWSKGQGLGKDGVGMREALVVKKKEDPAGVGANTGSGWDWEMKFWEKAYNSAVQSISHKEGNSSSSDSDSSSDDEEPTRRRRTMQATRPDIAAVLNRDGTTTSASAAEMAITAELAKDPWGRWGGKVGKMARIAQQEQRLAEEARRKLGHAPKPAVAMAAVAGLMAAAVAPRGGTAAGNERSSASESDAVAAEPEPAARPSRKRKAAATKVVTEAEPHANAARKTRDKSKAWPATKDAAAALDNGSLLPSSSEPITDPAQPARQVVVTLQKNEGPAHEALLNFRATPYTGWWGASTFRSSGCLEGLDKQQQEQRETAAAAAAADGLGAPVVAPLRQTFNEDDQEALYMTAHDKQRQGRGGLGKSDSHKFAGGAWKGAKTTFDEAPAVSVEAASAALAEVGMDALAKGNLAVAVAFPAATSSNAVWVNRAKAALKKVPTQRLKLKALCKQLIKDHGDNSLAAKELVSLLTLKAAKHKKLHVDGKFLLLS